jgi:hypothetical protein
MRPCPVGVMAGLAEDEQERGAAMLRQECYPGVDLRHLRGRDLPLLTA